MLEWFLTYFTENEAVLEVAQGVQEQLVKCFIGGVFRIENFRFQHRMITLEFSFSYLNSHPESL